MVGGKVNLVMDGAWGSAGKGKLVGYLALRSPVTASVCDFMTNAGHWFRSKRRGDFLVQQIPMAAVNPNIELFICAGAAITENTLVAEIAKFEEAGISIRDRLTIDPHAAIIEKHHGEEEALELGRISSTLKGCGAALAAKVMRKRNLKIAQESAVIREYLGVAVEPVQPKIKHMLDHGAIVLGELAQGFDLSLNHGWVYPYVTSRDITPMSFMANLGLPSRYLGDVYAVMRTFPIRVGNVWDADGRMTGYSGDFYPDQHEVTWDEISRRLGETVLERTTVTNKVRRVFTFSDLQYQRFISYCEPDSICLNFCNYFPGIGPSSEFGDLMANAEFKSLYDRLASYGIPIEFFGTGADDDAMVHDLTARPSLAFDFTNERAD